MPLIQLRYRSRWLSGPPIEIKGENHFPLIHFHHRFGLVLVKLIHRMILLGGDFLCVFEYISRILHLFHYYLQLYYEYYYYNWLKIAFLFGVYRNFIIVVSVKGSIILNSTIIN